LKARALVERQFRDEIAELTYRLDDQKARGEELGGIHFCPTFDSQIFCSISVSTPSIRQSTSFLDDGNLADDSGGFFNQSPFLRSDLRNFAARR
jgi:hypothetical protein